MPSFCRHNRFVQNCPICREPEPPRRKAAKRASSGTATRRSTGGSSSRGSKAVRVRHLARAAEDGYASPLVPGLKASADAVALADEIGFATGRLAELSSDPPGLYFEAGGAPSRDEGIWLALQVVLIGPLQAEDGRDPFAALREAVVPWDGGGVPQADALTLGPRSPFADPAAAVAGLGALRAWIERQGGPSAAFDGDAAWTAERRFSRLLERMSAVSRIGRGAYDALEVLGRLGLAEVEADALHAGDRDDATLAAKRVFGIGDRLLLDRRARDLADAAEVPIAALDLALANAGRPAGRPRITMGATDGAADPEARDRAAAALGVD